MIKVIEADGNVFKLDNNVAWLMEYEDQFGHDILPDLMPVLGAILEYMEGAVASGVSIKDVKDVTKAIQGGASTTGALVELSAFRVTDLIRIVWALAKTADPTIDPPKQWAKQFDPFPFDVLLPEVLTLVTRGAMSSKNSERLLGAMSELQGAKANG